VGEVVCATVVVELGGPAGCPGGNAHGERKRGWSWLLWGLLEEKLVKIITKERR